ncbi:hypothetical protein FSARC_2792 [Fusarium sarcochroum]|uniref:Uncharacterized protein n=1 Tax=Fusarium sarcochroum TaxID=1208366 RepID=A0A8H4U5E5_9HYPO|nr:hypothetical protein FSARC_2792 [Fusarium sarcochroum]
MAPSRTVRGCIRQKMKGKAKASSTQSKSNSIASNARKRSLTPLENDRSLKRLKSQQVQSRQKVEAPLLKDFKKPYGIPKGQFAWGPREPSPEEESFDEEETARPPSVPNAFHKCARSGREANVMMRAFNVNPASALGRRRPPSPFNGLSSISISSDPDPDSESNSGSDSDSGSPTPTPEPQVIPQNRSKKKKTKPCGLMDLPAEVREEIYRGLLVSHKPIPVYDGWKRVYQREKPGLHIEILMVNREISMEASGVLYGENTFLYRLRDAPGRSIQMFNIQDLANHDLYVPGSDDEEHVRESFFRSPLEPPHEPGTINIDKYARYFRYITVQADHNRDTAETQEFMAAAIKTFAQAPGKTNIHTLSIVISPRYMDGKFTFVNFFEPNSDLVMALKAVCCEVLRIRIWNKYLNDGIGSPCTELVLRAHQLRFIKNLAQQKLECEGESELKKQDIWHTDTKMNKFRFKRLREINKKLARLKLYVLKACQKHVQEYIIKQRNLKDAQGGHDEDEEDEFYYGPYEDEGQDEEVPSDNEDDSDFEPI